MADALAAGNENSLDAILKLITTFSGSPKQTQTTTESSKVSAEGLQAILKQALEGNQGLAHIASGQANSGLYNSSTNQLLQNDLLSRLTAQAAANSKTSTQTRTLQTAPVVGQKGQTLAGALAIGKSLYSGLDSKTGQGLLSKGKGLLDTVFSSGDLGGVSSGVSVAPVAGITDYGSLGNTFTSAGLGDSGQTIQLLADSTSLGGLDSWMQSAAADTPVVTGDTQAASSFMSSPSVTSADSGTVTASGDSGTNFLSAASGTTSSLGLTSSSSGAASSAVSGGTTYIGANQTYDTSNAAGKLLSDTSSGYGASAGDMSTAASSATTSTDILGGSGSSIGYLGSLYSATQAPDAEYGKDYRQAVGSAVLNYFGFGWATPIVDAVARPLLDNAMKKGYESNGDFGVVMADPIGAPLSGQYDQEALVTSTLDPANIFGGNEGGSVGGFLAAGIDPIGAALGDEGIFSEIKDGINSIADALGLPGGGGGGCFITTAVCKTIGLPDDCYELRILREFRDSWLRSHHPDDIVIYYKTAPTIVFGLDQREDSKDLYLEFYGNYIVPAVKLIEVKQYQAAYEKYRDLYSLALNKSYFDSLE